MCKKNVFFFIFLKTRCIWIFGQTPEHSQLIQAPNMPCLYRQIRHLLRSCNVCWKVRAGNGKCARSSRFYLAFSWHLKPGIVLPKTASMSMDKFGSGKARKPTETCTGYACSPITTGTCWVVYDCQTA